MDAKEKINATISFPIEFKVMQEDLTQVKSSLATIIANQKPSLAEDYIDNKEFCKVLRISSRTAQNYRDSGRIGFSQIGSKILYKVVDVRAFIDVNYNANMEDF